MKKCLLTFSAFLIVLSSLFSQNYLINFTAVTPNSATIFDSIQVYNLNQNTGKTLFFGDILQLGHLGISNYNSGNEKVKLFPNPNNGNADLSFYSESSGITYIKVFDLAGKEISSVSQHLNIGIHKFNLSGINRGMYFINIYGLGFNYTVKLLSQNSSSQDLLIKYSGYEDYKQIQKSLKNAASTVFMDYNNGEQLLLKGYSGVYKKIITAIPTSDNTIHFNFIECKDIENHHYATVKIGSQNWMAENLKATTYRNGDSIPYILIDTNWMNTKKGAYGYYNNNANMATLHGNLYNFYVVEDLRKLCPAGWKIPAETDWSSLISYLGGDLTAGGKMKETGNLTWVNNTAASNNSGFSALGSGMRSMYGQYSELGNFAYFWSADKQSPYTSFYKRLYNLNDNITSDFSSFNDGFSIRCIKDTANMISYMPVLTTIPVNNITITSAHSGGNVTNFGGSAIVNRGLCYSTSPNPTIDDSVVYLQGPNGNGAFIGDITGLSGGTTYYVRAFAVNAFSVAYGNEIFFTTQLPANGGLTDIDGNVYDTIVIGNQVWMRQNLKVTKYNNGNDLPHITANAAWSALTSGAYCHYGNNTSTGATYGKLYNYYVVSDNRNICPVNWHVPHLAEWQALETYLGGNSIAGGKLKAVDTVYWASPNADATNSSGFTAFGGGSRSSTGVSGDMGYYGNWWTNDEYDATKAYAMDLSYGNGTSHLYQRTKSIGMSIRCIKDTVVVVPPFKVYDIDGNAYDTVQIGTQIWLKQNLKVTKYRNGDTIQNVTNANAWAALTGGAYSNYNNDTNMAVTYGRLYNWFSVADTRNICPLGWHVPSDGEWTILENYLGGSSLAGGNLKEAGFSHWQAPNTNATNSSNFTALPGGNRLFNGVFVTMGSDGNWWTSTEYNSLNGLNKSMYSNGSNISTYNHNKPTGYSVRCMKDSVVVTPFKVYDIDGNAYDTVQIGTQVWLKQNLKVTKFRNGNAIPNYTSNSTYSNLTTEAYSNYNNDTNTANIYGKLYNWYAVNDSRGLCPTGWHVSTDSELSNLATYLGGSNIAGGKLKEVGLTHWFTPNTGADNISGFTALPGGYRSFTGNYFNLNYYCYLWTANDTTSTFAWYNYFSYNDIGINRVDNNKKLGHSVRCIKDSVVFTPFKVYDIDGNAYDTVQIGTQVWLKQNLKTTRYNNGITIPNVTNDTVWSGITSGARCYYNNDSATYSNTYGALYNWYAVNTGNLCPVGWHVPLVNKWTSLIAYLGGYYLSGGKLKATTLWNSPNTGATNETGYSALPGGYRLFNGPFNGIYEHGRWWMNSMLYGENQIIPLNYNESYITIETKDNRSGLSVRCHKGDFATVLTDSISGVSLDSAICGGNITSDGGMPVTVKGIVWSTSPYPKINALSTKTIDGSGLGSFSSLITVLSANTTYYVRAYATNAAGTAYGNQVIFTTLPRNYSVYDIDSNGYDTIHIGTQVWLKQNLKTTRYNNGITIPNVTNDTVWSGLTSGARCYYNNDSATYSNTYGALYNGFLINNGNLCPVGWHIPNDLEWIELTNYLGGDSIAGGKLKTTTLWFNPNVGASNETGFSALPSGIRSYDGVCWDISLTCAWWTSIDSSVNNPFIRYVSHDSKTLYRSNYYDKRNGLSVRCLRN